MKQIVIEKLFGEHNVVIDIEKKLNIMIGENGIGKTTILKIIDSLYSLDFISLTKFSFRTIKIITNNDLVEIKKADLFPEIKTILGEIHDRLEEDDNSRIAYDAFIKGIHEAVTDKPDIYSEFLTACYFGTPLSNKVKRNISSSCYHRDLELFDPMYELSSVLKNNEMHLESRFTDEVKYFEASQIARIVKKSDFKKYLKSFFDRSIVSLNMVNKYALKDNSIVKPPIYSNIIIWLNMYEDISTKNRVDESEGSFWDRKIYFEEPRIGLPMTAPPKFASEYIGLLKKAYTDIEYNFFDNKSDVDKIIDRLATEQVVDINGVINRFFYSEEYMKEINNKAISYYSTIIGKEADYSNVVNAYSEFDDEERNNIEDYLQPIILEESIFGQSIKQILNSSFQTNQENTELIRAFRQFYNENIENVMNAKDKKVQQFEIMLNQFVSGKTFIATPSGLKVFLNKYKEYENGKFKVIENESNEIRLMDLSSGEKKLVIILLFSCLFDDLFLMMDEPELSFSINWQEKILEAITDQDNNNGFLIATHSPFIVSNEEIAESILPLPLEE